MSEFRLTGGCQCGAVRYALLEEPSGPHICHCRMCQKAFGSFFAPLTGVSLDKFELTRGELAIFKSSDLVERGFCRNCGTPLSFHFVDSDRIAVSIGSLDEPERIEPNTSSGTRRDSRGSTSCRASPERDDQRDRRSFPHHRNCRFEPPAPRPRHGRLAAEGEIAMSESRLTGGCQCGAVRYALHEEPTGAHICHCRMCQKAFGSFFAPLAGVPVDKLRIHPRRAFDLQELRSDGARLLQQMRHAAHHSTTSARRASTIASARSTSRRTSSRRTSTASKRGCLVRKARRRFPATRRPRKTIPSSTRRSPRRTISIPITTRRIGPRTARSGSR